MKNILVIYTGGTIGSVEDKGLLLAGNNFWHNFLKKIETKKVEKHLLELIKNAKVIEFSNPVDSSYILKEFLKKVSNIIHNNGNDYDGYLVIQGTDTLSYTASFFSYFLNSLEKPIVFTASMIPIYQRKTDGINNILTAFEAINNFDKGCYVSMNSKISLASRTNKIGNTKEAAFYSDSYVDKNTNYYNKEIIEYPKKTILSSNFNYDNNVSYVEISPFMNFDVIKAIADNSDGILFGFYGTGGAPDNNKEFCSAFNYAIDKCKIVAIKTQVINGEIKSIYHAGNILKNNDKVVVFKNIFTPSALAKIYYSLGVSFKNDEMVNFLTTNISGELR